MQYKQKGNSDELQIPIMTVEFCKQSQRPVSSNNQRFNSTTKNQLAMSVTIQRIQVFWSLSPGATFRQHDNTSLLYKTNSACQN